MIFTVQQPMRNGLDTLIGRIQAEINTVFSLIGIQVVNLGSISRNILPITAPPSFIPSIPGFNAAKMEIKNDTLSLHRTLAPWVSDRIDDMLTVAWIIFWIGFGIAIIPAILVICSFLSAFIPEKVNDFFLVPQFVHQS